MEVKTIQLLKDILALHGMTTTVVTLMLGRKLCSQLTSMMITGGELILGGIDLIN